MSTTKEQVQCAQLYAGFLLFNEIVPHFVDLSHFRVAFFIYAAAAVKRHLPCSKGNAARTRPSGREIQ